jgi:two-component system response regulator AtoC
VRILIVDDEDNIRGLMIKYLATDGITAIGAENGLSAQRKLLESGFDAMLLDVRMPGMNGLELLKWVKDEGLRLPIIMISAHGDVESAVQALKSGADDYIIKPFNPEEVTMKLKNLVAAQRYVNIAESKAGSDEGFFIGESEPMLKIKEMLERISKTASNVLITGESGTGKEVVARAIHAKSNQSSGPFVAINIGGVPENLLESELFGHEKGAFTGAIARKSGMFELASGGTLFLDEVGEMPLQLQVKLLRVLQDRKITRLGGTIEIPINARIICATNRDLEKMVTEGTFREDLFYRLNVIRISIPPLRERQGDIELLCIGLLKRLGSEMGKRVDGLTPDAMARLKSHSFYGNVRELENILERAVIFADGPLITSSCLDLRGSVAKPDVIASIEAAPREAGQARSLKEIEQDAIIQALRRWEGNRTKASEELGITRRTLINKIAEYNIDL